MYNPWGDLAQREDLTFGMALLPQGEAWWFPEERGIVLDLRLDRTQRRCALAHELAHVDHDDTTTSDARTNRRQETKADNLASRRLVDVDSLADAIVLHEWPEDVAEHLDVTLHALRCRLRDLTEDERSYLNTRLDAVERGLP